MTPYLRSLLLAGMVFLAGCALPLDRSGLVPDADRYELFQPAGYSHPVRAYDDATPEAFAQLQEAYSDWATHWPGAKSGLNILALSGGGQHGAFGAGVLAGWSAAGSRPEFDLVTGISTGALIAPFAYLGPAYDAQLKRFYTETTTRDIVNFSLSGLFRRGAFGSTAPLASAIRREMTAEVIRAIAVEARRGRSLLIGTTNLDAERSVLWDIGAMAQVDTPDSHDLIRKVILASASIPVAFEPVRIKVTDGDIVREELHVDGGLTREIFVYPGNFDMRRVLRLMGAAGRRNTIWLLQNKRIERRFEAQALGIRPIAERTFDLLIQSQTIGDTDFVLSLAARDGFRAHLMSIPTSFDEEAEDVFDRDYMNALYKLGFEAGQSGKKWRRNAQAQFY